MTGTDIRDQLAAEIAAGHRYEVVLADPPLPHNRGYAAGAERRYPTMHPAGLRALPVAEVAAPDAVLLLWTTGAHLELSLRLLRAWRFRYSGVAFTWAKQRPSGSGWWVGLGHWTNKQCEYVLIGLRGHPRRRATTVRELIVAPRRQHSRKPDALYSRIERLFGDVRRLELFGRAHREGWTVLGNDTTRFAGSEPADQLALAL